MTAGPQPSVADGEGRADRGSRPAPPNPVVCNAAPGPLSAAHRPLQRSTAAPLITVAGARGGHGASTVAAVVALILAAQQPVTLIADEVDHAAALLGVPTPDGPTRIGPGQLVLASGPQTPAGAVVVDHACPGPRRAPEGRHGTLLTVLRGPCYLGLRSLIAAGCPADGIVLLGEPGRALTERDVADATGIPVVATVAVTPAAARTIDAGLLLARHASLREFTELRRWLARHPAALNSVDSGHQAALHIEPPRIRHRLASSASGTG